MRTLIIEAFIKAFDKYDVIIAPTVPTTAYKSEREKQKSLLIKIICIPYRQILRGFPGMSIPCGVDKDGLPIGLHLVAKPFGESTF